MSIEGIELLRIEYPWPLVPPDVPRDDSGWMSDSARELLCEVLDSDTELVVELGSWLGLSTRWILEVAPNATVVAVDHWLGDEATKDEPVLPVLYETFLVNNWEYRDRLVPMRTTTREGIARIRELGLQPDAIFIDAAHDYENARDDVASSLPFGCTLVGDDFNPNAWPGVVRAVWEQSVDSQRRMCVLGSTWIIRPAPRTSTDGDGVE